MVQQKLSAFAAPSNSKMSWKITEERTRSKSTRAKSECHQRGTFTFFWTLDHITLKTVHVTCTTPAAAIKYQQYKTMPGIQWVKSIAAASPPVTCAQPSIHRQRDFRLATGSHTGPF